MEKKREAQLLLDAELKEIKTNQVNQKVTRHQLMVLLLKCLKYLSSHNVYNLFIYFRKNLLHQILSHHQF